MQVAAVHDPIAAIREEYRRRRGVPLPTRVSRVLVDAWRRGQERRIEDALHWLDHEGVWQDFRRASDA
jgi:hypothetical protein